MYKITSVDQVWVGEWDDSNGYQSPSEALQCPLFWKLYLFKLISQIKETKDQDLISLKTKILVDTLNHSDYQSTKESLTNFYNHLYPLLPDADNLIAVFPDKVFDFCLENQAQLFG